VHSPPAIQRTIGDKTFFMASSNQDLFGLWDHIAVLKPRDKWAQLMGEEENVLTMMILEDVPTFGALTLEEKAIQKCDNYPYVIFIQTKSSKQYGKQLDKYKDFPYKYCYIFVWEKNKSNRYELTIQRCK
jgi:hypothetical protein